MTGVSKKFVKKLLVCHKYSIFDVRIRSILGHTRYKKALLSTHFAGTKRRTFRARVKKKHSVTWLFFEHVFHQHINNFSAILLCKINVLDIFDIGNFFHIFYYITKCWNCNRIKLLVKNVRAIHPEYHSPNSVRRSNDDSQPFCVRFEAAWEIEASRIGCLSSWFMLFTEGLHNPQASLISTNGLVTSSPITGPNDVYIPYIFTQREYALRWLGGIGRDLQISEIDINWRDEWCGNVCEVCPNVSRNGRESL